MLLIETILKDASEKSISSFTFQRAIEVSVYAANICYVLTRVTSISAVNKSTHSPKHRLQVNLARSKLAFFLNAQATHPTMKVAGIHLLPIDDGQISLLAGAER